MVIEFKNWLLERWKPSPALSRMRLGPEGSTTNPLMVGVLSEAMHPRGWNTRWDSIFYLVRRWNELVETLRNWNSEPCGPRVYSSLASTSQQSCKTAWTRLWCVWPGICYSHSITICVWSFLQWDLGEFDQKGSVATRWGTKEELLQACNVARQNQIDILIDAVLNVRGLNPMFFWLLIWPFIYLSTNLVQTETNRSWLFLSIRKID